MKMLKKKILEFCIDAKIAKEIAEFCGYKGIDRFKRNYLKPLLESGKIIMTLKNRYQKTILIIPIAEYTLKENVFV